MNGKNFYEVLGVHPEATDEEIRQAFKNLALKYHPDKNRNNPDAAEHFKAINNAYKTLSNRTNRQKYDRTLLTPQVVWNQKLHSAFDWNYIKIPLQIVGLVLGIVFECSRDRPPVTRMVGPSQSRRAHYGPQPASRMGPSRAPFNSPLQNVRPVFNQNKCSSVRPPEPFNWSKGRNNRSDRVPQRTPRNDGRTEIVIQRSWIDGKLIETTRSFENGVEIVIIRQDGNIISYKINGQEQKRPGNFASNLPF